MNIEKHPMLTTEIVESKAEKLTCDMTDWPEYKRNIKGILYLDEFDGDVDETQVTAIEIPTNDQADQSSQPQYQCIKCGKIQTNQEEMHRMKCSRCYNKAFNKIRPTKWVKFSAY